MSGCRHEWHDYHRLSFPCPDCGAWADEGNSSATDYHELTEVPRCCGTCAWLNGDVYDGEATPDMWCHHSSAGNKNGFYLRVAPHGLCSHWERRDDGG